ncbi:alpha/beta-Hydrolases superfamily protein [Wolffia australiana]
MPFCDVSKYEYRSQRSDSSHGIKIFYRRYGRGKTKVLLITGLAGTHASWGPQIRGLTGSVEPNDENPASGVLEDEEDDGIEVCSFDNRGMGRSSIPTKKSEYTTLKMAKDALALLDHLGWKKAHVIGHSMGGMIACKLASLAPNRLSSLALLNVTGGGYECLPKINGQMISLAYRFLRATNPEQRAMVDLETHYTREYLEEKMGSSTRGQVLYQEYVRAISSAGMQSPHGFEGQINACWTHKITSKEVEVIRSGGFHVSVIHGRHDIIAQMSHAKRLAVKLRPVARMVELHGAHLVSHERPEEVNRSLFELIKASESNVSFHMWSTAPKKETGRRNSSLATPSIRLRNEEGCCLETTSDVLSKLQLSFLYLFGLLMMAFGHIWKILRLSKAARVGETVS